MTRPPTKSPSPLDGLKDFQQRSAEWVFRRLFKDRDAVDRFLLADEVGLGKTIVARGVVAKTIEHLNATPRRVDVVYICSNADIARQNVNRLVVGTQEFSLASRLTLLPLQTGRLAAKRCNFVSFTPGTSFDLGYQTGVIQERALLYHLVRGAWRTRGSALRNALRANVGPERWRRYVREFERTQVRNIDPGIERRFARALRKHDDLRASYRKLAPVFSQQRPNVPHSARADRKQFVASLRRLLAECCIDALKPDLIILDEFQRFRYLLKDQGEVGSLARQLFEYRDRRGRAAKILLLSATPYKPFTTAGEIEKHHDDLLDTMRFLLSADPGALASLDRALHDYGRELHPRGDAEALAVAKGRIEVILRRVMCRTERLAVTQDRNGMIGDAHVRAADLGAREARAYRMLCDVGRELEAGTSIEFWKSSPYVLNFMDRDYQLKDELVEAIEDGDSDLRQALRVVEEGLLPWKAIERYRVIDPGNVKMRALFGRVLDAGAWRLLWVPPSLPYWRPSGPYADPRLGDFTKVLAFSSWRVVPKVIAALGSYEAERRACDAARLRVRYSDLSDRLKPLLRITKSRRKLTGMGVIPLLYPSLTLAIGIDPLSFRRGSSGNDLSSAASVFGETRDIVRRLLQPVLERYGRRAGPFDRRWYWAGPCLLDEDHATTVLRWWQDADDAVWAGDEYGGVPAFSDHIALAASLLESPRRLGRPPHDLVDVVAKLALASPAVVSLRALSRRWPDGRDRRALTIAATEAAFGLMNLYNRPEATLLLHGKGRGSGRYWERVLEHGIEGNLQAVLDEYVHVLVETLGLRDRPFGSAREVGKAMHEAASLQAVSLTYDDIRIRGRVRVTTRRMRCRFAMRFGAQGREDAEDGRATHQDQVRASFNSPFRPFVLASTSVGQEGLDFHPYCHAVCHWNLPSNPVDLEQREGRVHRYKGHFIRKNLAAAFARERFMVGTDPWERLFRLGSERRTAGSGDLIPFWIFEGPSRIERIVASYPLSRDQPRLEALKRNLARYRLPFGQARQEDILRLLGEAADAFVRTALIDLSPPVLG